MSLAQRVREIRYAKGWGPDELANRADISRTALYQIESGKTGLPRAGTLRRIAVALEVPMEDLLAHEDQGAAASSAASGGSSARRARSLADWAPADGGPFSIAAGVDFKGLNGADEARFAVETALASRANGHEAIYLREGELISKLHDLIHSPIGEAVVRIIDELHRVLSRSRVAN
jgi:transcriptional regulator with XRE-family HTH domain